MTIKIILCILHVQLCSRLYTNLFRVLPRKPQFKRWNLGLRVNVLVGHAKLCGDRAPATARQMEKKSSGGEEINQSHWVLDTKCDPHHPTHPKLLSKEDRKLWNSSVFSMLLNVPTSQLHILASSWTNFPSWRSWRGHVTLYEHLPTWPLWTNHNSYPCA